MSKIKIISYFLITFMLISLIFIPQSKSHMKIFSPNISRDYVIRSNNIDRFEHNSISLFNDRNFIKNNLILRNASIHVNKINSEPDTLYGTPLYKLKYMIIRSLRAHFIVNSTGIYDYYMYIHKGGDEY